VCAARIEGAECELPGSRERSVRYQNRASSRCPPSVSASSYRGSPARSNTCTRATVRLSTSVALKVIQLAKLPRHAGIEQCRRARSTHAPSFQPVRTCAPSQNGFCADRPQRQRDRRRGRFNLPAIAVDDLAGPGDAIRAVGQWRELDVGHGSSFRVQTGTVSD
jgi:hypothetical protein